VVAKIELVRSMRVRRAKPYYLRTSKRRLGEVVPKETHAAPEDPAVEQMFA
jgi:ribosomal protein L19